MGDAELLGGTALFQSLSPAQREALLADPACTRALFAKNEVVYDARRFRRSLGLLLEGSLRVNKRELLVNVLEPGDFFGAAALFGEEDDYAVTLTAARPGALLFFPQALMERVLRDHPAVALAYVRYLSGRIRFLSAKLEAVLDGSAEGKLERYLREHCDAQGVYDMDHPVAELAGRLGVSRASLYRAFDALARAGVIRRERKRLILPELAAERKEEKP